MTLEQWAAEIGEVVQTHANGCKYVVTDKRILYEAFHLSDYILSSANGITFWFIPR